MSNHYSFPPSLPQELPGVAHPADQVPVARAASGEPPIPKIAAEPSPAIDAPSLLVEQVAARPAVQAAADQQPVDAAADCKAPVDDEDECTPPPPRRAALQKPSLSPIEAAQEEQDRVLQGTALQLLHQQRAEAAENKMPKEVFDLTSLAPWAIRALEESPLFWSMVCNEGCQLVRLPAGCASMNSGDSATNVLLQRLSKITHEGPAAEFVFEIDDRGPAKDEPVKFVLNVSGPQPMVRYFEERFLILASGVSKSGKLVQTASICEGDEYAGIKATPDRPVIVAKIDGKVMMVITVSGMREGMVLAHRSSKFPYGAEPPVREARRDDDFARVVPKQKPELDIDSLIYHRMANSPAGRLASESKNELFFQDDYDALEALSDEELPRVRSLVDAELAQIREKIAAREEMLRVSSDVDDDALNKVRILRGARSDITDQALNNAQAVLGVIDEIAQSRAEGRLPKWQQRWAALA